MVKVVNSVSPEARERLNRAQRQFGSQEALALKAGIPRSTLQKMLRGDGDPGLSSIVKVTEALGESVDWLVYGGSGPYARYGIGPDSGDWETSLPRIADDRLRVPIYDIEASAGNGREPLEEGPTSWIEVPKSFFAGRYTVAHDLAMLQVVGDSMEPYMRSGDAIIIDRTQRRAREGVFVVLVGHNLYAKRLREVGAGRLSLVSDNPSYPPIEVDLSIEGGFSIKGRVVWTGCWR